MTSESMEKPTDYDVVVIGGGINGAGIARDAAGRGLKVLLCEQDDLAAHTSSASTKLIHGGLRYLEHYDFMLVRHALQEREVLLEAAPHIIWPMRFILPHHKDLRPRWLIRLGLFLYDHIGGRKRLPASHSVKLNSHASGAALKDSYSHAFEYSDCWVQDARLVVLNAMDAQARGATILTQTQCTDIIRGEGRWSVNLLDKATQKSFTVSARSIVNASGPWVEKTLDLDEEHDAKHGVRLVKGSHIVVPKMFDHPYTYIFQNADNRIIFAVPYERDFTLLGTTDVEVGDEPGRQTIEKKEIEYICDNANHYFKQDIKPSDVVWTYSGVRPLYDDASENASKVTRDYKLDLDKRKGAPVLSVYGGKITTYRKLSEQAMNMLCDEIGHEQGAWTAPEHLPGGDFNPHEYGALVSKTQHQYPWLDKSIVVDYTRNYGTLVSALLGDAKSLADMGQHFGGPLYQIEVDYLVANEFAKSAEDILWRRSKKGLFLQAAEVEALTSYLAG